MDTDIIEIARKAVVNSDPGHPTVEQMLLLKYSLKALLEIIDTTK